MAAPGLRAELGRRIDRGVHVPSQSFLRRDQGGRHDVESSVPDDEEIDVAVGAQLPACSRAKHESHSDLVSQRRQRLAQDVDERCGLQKQGLKLREDSSISIRLEVDLASLGRPAEQAGPGEPVELLLHGPLGGAGLPDDLTKVERGLGVAEQQPEHPAASLAEQDARGVQRPYARGVGSALRRARQHPHRERLIDRLATAAHLELLVDVLEVVVDGLGRDRKPLGDLLVLERLPRRYAIMMMSDGNMLV